MTWDEFMGPRKDYTWHDAMLFQAIVALSVGSEFSTKTPMEIFEHLENTRPGFNGESLVY